MIVIKFSHSHHWCIIIFAFISLFYPTRSYNEFPVGSVSGKFIVANPWNISTPLGIESGVL